jgi:hypothetical protein
MFFIASIVEIFVIFKHHMLEQQLNGGNFAASLFWLPCCVICVEFNLAVARCFKFQQLLQLKDGSI